MIKSTIFFVLIISINFQINSNAIHSCPETSIFTEEKMLGIDANYVSTMKDSIFRWRYGITPIDIYSP